MKYEHNQENFVKQNENHRISIESIEIGLASPKQIKKWAQRILPNGKKIGQVTNPETVHYNTLKPIKGGLFCERIFGPVKDFECSCGKKKSYPSQKFCAECDVEFTWSRVRRHRLGFIQLASPVTHIWYLRGRLSYISSLLGMKRKHVEAITYCTKKLNGTGVENWPEIFQYGEKKNTQVNSDHLSLIPLKLSNYNKVKNIDTDLNDQVELNSSKNLQVDVSPSSVLKKIKFIDPSEWVQNNEKNSDFNLKVNSIKHLNQEKHYFPILPTSVWKSNDDINDFLKYITVPPQEQDIPISLCTPQSVLGTDFSTKTDAEYRYKVPVVSHRQPFVSEPKILNNSESLPTHLTVNNGINKTLANTGAEAVRKLLIQLNIYELKPLLKEYLEDLEEQILTLENQGFLLRPEYRFLQRLRKKRSQTYRRLKLLTAFQRTKALPEWMVLSILPVLPPELRPILKLDKNSPPLVNDLNRLYRLIFFRNMRLLKTEPAPYDQRLLQEAVDALIENGKGGSKPVCTPDGRQVKSLSDILKGKKGRFRQNLLGKRVDYSGRSVIVVGPNLKLHECGLPKEMAIELFQPFLVRQLMVKKIAGTIVTAKSLIQEQNPIIWELLQQIMQRHPVLLNRAPTLHRLGIQAFQPKLVNGRAILLHPLVCSAFNADFDGDQMAVHVPLSFQARAEAWKLMWSRNNLLSPATGQPILIPSQDMVLGCYYLTTNNIKPHRGMGYYFSNFEDVLKAYYQKKIDIHSPIWVKCTTFIENSNDYEKPLEIQINCEGSFTKIYSKHKRNFDENRKQISQFVRTTTGRVFFNLVLSSSRHNLEHMIGAEQPTLGIGKKHIGRVR
uniref:DNA-directed RNA polymerase subunit beta' n=1 Tax=Lobosphaera incisa TaxID=312850 RepID=A0A097KM57_9CHLO|nr:beta' subunit of RNA polymerase [Lobosphaera incisa]AIT94263.1 beta' subunit of RNA polymerase [Lobosphaera incisa]